MTTSYLSCINRGAVVSYSGGGVERETPKREYRLEKNYKLGTRVEEDLYTVRNYTSLRQISVYLCIIYGIVI